MITNKNDLHDITDILLKVTFNAITLTPYPLNLMTHIVIGYEVSCLLNITNLIIVLRLTRQRVETIIYHITSKHANQYTNEEIYMSYNYIKKQYEDI
jgi:hypothetical protein